MSEVPELACDHEEADTRLLLHAKHAGQHFSSVILRSPDTDVAIISLSLATKIQANVCLLSGTSGKEKLVDIDNLAATLGGRAVEALPGYHAFTGCDSVSAFYSKGKVKTWKVAKTEACFLEAFEELGKSFTLTAETLHKLEQYVCALYGYPKLNSVNEVRYRAFCLGSGARGMPHTVVCESTP